jgi:pyrimidine operon attenuation protein/uracil phosphoribosyltransferase
MQNKLTPKATILDAPEMARIVRRMAGEIAERNRGVKDLLLIGIRTRGVPLAEALAAEIGRMRSALEEILSRHSNKSPEEVRKDIDRDKILTAAEAKDYGLIDEVLEYRKLA